MNQFRPLIENQNLRIDNHIRGVVSPPKWGSGLHIHKSFKDQKRKSIEILIPLDNDSKIEIRGINKRDAKGRQIQKEIESALKANTTRKNFAEDLHNAIDEFLAQDLSIEELRNVSKRIANHFGLDEDIESELIAAHKGKIEKYISLHADPDSKKHFEIKHTKGELDIKESNFRHSIYLKHSNRRKKTYHKRRN